MAPAPLGFPCSAYLSPDGGLRYLSRMDRILGCQLLGRSGRGDRRRASARRSWPVAATYRRPEFDPVCIRNRGPDEQPSLRGFVACGVCDRCTVHVGSTAIDAVACRAQEMRFARSATPGTDWRRDVVLLLAHNRQCLSPTLSGEPETIHSATHVHLWQISAED